MAHLNVRERRIETTIAYVGSALAGTTTNFERLRDAREGHAGALEETSLGEGALLSFEWRPLHMARFDDCDVMVKLVTTRGDVSDHEVGKVLAGADGVVVVLESDPAALDRNDKSLAAVQSALARDPRRCPVIVQVNARDLSEPLATGEPVSSLDVQAWPHVSACADRGEGVIETLERALADVIETIKHSAPSAKETPASSADARPAAPKAEGNPLLTALRQTLQATVAEHVAALEERVTRRLEERLGQLDESLASMRSRLESAGKPAEIPTELARMPVTLQALRDEIASIDHSLGGLWNVLAGTAEQSANAAREHEENIAKILAAANGMRADVATFEEKMLAAVEARSRSDREHATGAASVLRRAVEAIAVDVKELRKADTREATRDLAARVEALAGTSEAVRGLVEPTATGVRALRTRIDDLEAKLRIQVREDFTRRLEPIDEAVQFLQAETSGALARVDARSEVIEASLAELITELKQRKKGWFG